MRNGGRSAKRGFGGVVALAVLLVVSTSARAAVMSLSYAVTLPDATGAQHNVNFQGSIDGRMLSGTVQIDGVPHDVVSSVGGDFSLSGRVFGQDGKVIGLFWGRPDARGFKGRYDLGGQVGEWNIPRVTLPASIP